MFENKIKEAEEETQSNGIGIQSVKNMMGKMGGKCKAAQEGNCFRVSLMFPTQAVQRQR
ncbi:MAG: GHKL domain-containing protein [Lachnospiraceae bacterium]